MRRVKKRRARCRLCIFAAFFSLLIAFTACRDASGSSSQASSQDAPSKAVESAEIRAAAGAGRSAASNTSSAAASPSAGVSSAAERSSLPAAAQPEIQSFPAKTGASTFLYAQPAPGDTLAVLDVPGQEVTVSPTDDLLWYSATLENGTSGYLYGEVLYDLEGNCLFSKNFQERLSVLREKLPEGKYWNHMGKEDAYGEESPYSVTDTPCDHYDYGELYCNFYNGATKELFLDDTLCQCLGFASFLSDKIFGEQAPLHVFYDPYDLRVGDHIRLFEYEHSMTVTEITEDGVTVAEVNEDYEHCQISWSRQLSWYELEDLLWDSEYITRYPFYADESGVFYPWDSGEG